MTEQGPHVQDDTADAAIKSLEEQLSILWRRARSNSHKVARRVHPDMEPAAYGLLVILQRTGAMRLTDLASNVGIGKPSVSRQITMLEQLGLVEKTADPEDGRAQAISLTPLGSDRLLTAAGRGHGTQPVRDAVRVAIEYGFRVNVDFIFGMPGETEEDLQASLRFAAELADLGARIHTHTFMPLPGTPWRDAQPAFIPLHAMRELDRLAQRGSAYGHWRRQADHAARLAETAKAYPRRTPRRRTGR